MPGTPATMGSDHSGEGPKCPGEALPGPLPPTTGARTARTGWGLPRIIRPQQPPAGLRLQLPLRFRAPQVGTQRTGVHPHGAASGTFPQDKVSQHRLLLRSKPGCPQPRMKVGPAGHPRPLFLASSPHNSSTNQGA